MSIQHLNNTGYIAGFGQRQAEESLNQDEEAEALILSYLDAQHNMGRKQGLAVVAALRSACVDLPVLAQGLQAGELAAIEQIRVFVC